MNQYPHTLQLKRRTQNTERKQGLKGKDNE